MTVLSAILLSISLALAILLGPQTRPWTWGPSLLPLAASLLAALPLLWKRETHPSGTGLVVFGTVVAAWFAWRAALSPVAELATADSMLLAAAVGAFIVTRIIANHPLAEKILLWSVALLLLGSVLIIGKQVADPSYNFIFSRTGDLPAGFFRHYNECANFLAGAGFLLAGAALFGRHHPIIRIVWTLISVSALVAVYYTHSRGGIFAVTLGGGVFFLSTLAIGKRTRAKWFLPGAIALPLVGIALASLLFMSWEHAQEARGKTGSVTVMMDEPVRLALFGISMSTIAEHPLTGGGSRSFSWECYPFWERQLHGVGRRRPEYVHNEFLQASTDYGLIGSGLLLVFVGIVSITAIVRSLFSVSPQNGVSENSLRLGGLAGMAAMFVQSSFSFVFHLLPGALLFGICLARASQPQTSPHPPKACLSKGIISLVSLLCAGFLIPSGWTSSRVFSILWPDYFTKTSPANIEVKSEAMRKANLLWPQSALHRERAMMLQEAAFPLVLDKPAEPVIREILHDYNEAARLHPFDPLTAMNRANFLSLIGKDSEAEHQYQLATVLQGGMESAFEAHFHFSRHLMQKSIRELSSGKYEEAFASASLAAGELQKVAEKNPGMLRLGVGRNLYVSIHEALGSSLEAAGDFEGALEIYDSTLDKAPASRIQYRAANLIARMADTAWSEHRPSEALSLFLRAKKRITPVRELPPGISPQQKKEDIARLNANIRFLTEANIQPAPGFTE